MNDRLRPWLVTSRRTMISPSRGRRSKMRFDRGLDFAGPNQIGGRACAEQQTNCLDEDRLPRAGLARQNVEARLELDLDGLDHRKVADAKQAQHVGGTSIVSYV